MEAAGRASQTCRRSRECRRRRRLVPPLFRVLTSVAALSPSLSLSPSLGIIRRPDDGQQTSSFFSMRVAYSYHFYYPARGFSLIQEVRLCAIWPKENWPTRPRTSHTQGRMNNLNMLLSCCRTKTSEVGQPPPPLSTLRFSAGRPSVFPEAFQSPSRSTDGLRWSHALSPIRCRHV